MIMNISRETHSAEELQELAAELWREHLSKVLPTAIVLKLEGELGAGKTTFIQGLGKVLGIQEPLTSPSYTYVSEYDFDTGSEQGVLVHVDAWRVADPATAQLLGIQKYLRPHHIVAIEWPQRLPTLKVDPKSSVLVEINIVEISEGRRVNIFSQ
jgi:tRNA threonylcarbamoyladenosine biosynthesis protein TsaE